MDNAPLQNNWYAYCEAHAKGALFLNMDPLPSKMDFEVFTRWLLGQQDPVYFLAHPEFWSEYAPSVLHELKSASPDIVEPWKDWLLLLCAGVGTDQMFVDGMNFLRHQDNIKWGMGLYYGSGLSDDRLHRFFAVLNYVGQEPIEQQKEIYMQFVRNMRSLGGWGDRLNPNAWQGFLDQLDNGSDEVSFLFIKQVMRLVVYVDAMDGERTIQTISQCLDRFAPLFWSKATPNDISDFADQWVVCYDNVSQVRQKSIQWMMGIWNVFWTHPSTPHEVVLEAMVDVDPDPQRTQELLDTYPQTNLIPKVLSKVAPICPQHPLVVQQLLSRALDGHVAPNKTPKKL